jgi:hypothetical protein
VKFAIKIPAYGADPSVSSVYLTTQGFKPYGSPSTVLTFETRKLAEQHLATVHVSERALVIPVGEHFSLYTKNLVRDI